MIKPSALSYYDSDKHLIFIAWPLDGGLRALVQTLVHEITHQVLHDEHGLIASKMFDNLSDDYSFWRRFVG